MEAALAGVADEKWPDMKNWRCLSRLIFMVGQTKAPAIAAGL
jgi:hypothetical protein